MSYAHSVKPALSMECVFAALIFVVLLFAARVNNSGAYNPFQSWVHVTPRTDTTSVITTAHDAYDLLCDTAIIVKILYREHQ